MEAVAAFPRPWPESESKTSTKELLPEPTKSYMEKMHPWSAWAWRNHIISEVSVSVSQEVESMMEWLVEEQVRLHNAREIEAYLVEFPDLIGVIPQAVRAAKKHLPEAQLILKVYRDPEIEDYYLALYVRLPQYNDRVMERIEAAEAEFIDLLADVEGWLQLTTDFGEPEVG